jgi:hypothetical protein
VDHRGRTVSARARDREIAVAVADELQSMGIGTALATRTVQRARANGFALLTATTLWENRAARALLHRLGFRGRSSHGSEIELELELALDPHPASSRWPRADSQARRWFPNPSPRGTDVISPHVNMGIAQSKADDLRRAADAYRLAHPKLSRRRLLRLKGA